MNPTQAMRRSHPASPSAQRIRMPNTGSLLRRLGMGWRLPAAFTMTALIAGCADGPRSLVPEEDKVGVPIGAVGHYGSNIGVPEFSLDGRWGGNAGGWGGGSAGMCCVLLPRHVTEPVMVKVRWTSCDVGHIRYVNGRSVDPSARCKEEQHESTVPVHFAVEPGKSSGVYVHFLPGHRVELWVSRYGPSSTVYPGPPYPRGPAPDYAPVPDKKAQPATTHNK